jgi:putative tryptophan/tyrosine transport system substrate-binding protein
VGAFREGLKDGGVVEGRDVTTDLRSTEQYPELRSLADQLVQRRVALIAALGGIPAKVAKAVTARMIKVWNKAHFHRITAIAEVAA